MGKRNYTTEQIIVKLQEIEVLCGQRPNHRRGSTTVRNHRANILSMEKDIRWYEYRGRKSD